MTENLRFLHIEDNLLDAELVEAELRKEWPDCRYTLISTEKELSGSLAGGDFDAILCDFSLPDYDGMSALSYAGRYAVHTPFIFVTGAMGEEAAVATLKKGATDYILKTSLAKLNPSITRALDDKRRETDFVMLKEQVLNAAREWKSTFDSISDSIALIDTDQRVIRCNLATSKLLGREFADIISQPCWELFHGTDAPPPDCPMGKAKISLHSESSTIRHSDRWLEVTVDPLLSESGRMTGAVHIVRDVTERIGLVNSLKDANELFRLFMKHSPIYSFIKEVSATESRVLQASDNYQDMIGISSQDMIGKTMHQLFPAEFADKITADDQRTVLLNEVQRLEEHLHNGTYITYKFPIERADGTRLLAGYTIDITERKQAEETLHAMQTQLMQQDKLATIGQLAAGVAHEINNPMGFIGSNMVTLEKYIGKYNRYIDGIEQELRSVSSGKLPESIQLLRRSLKIDFIARDIDLLVDENNEGLDRVRHIVQDLMTFSHSDVAATGPTDLNRCMDGTINLLSNEIKYVAELTRDYGEFPPVSCNVQQIDQVFMNLLTNAIHAIQTKGEEVGKISVRTWSDHDNVFVSISDTGCGILPENLSKIFEPFYTTKEIGKGTGLGLPISAGIVRKHGGEIAATSNIGIGSTFTVRLPLKTGNHAGINRLD